MKLKQYLAMFVAVLLLLALPLSVSAQSGDLTVAFPVEGIAFFLYRVGEMNEGVVFDEPFASVSSAGIVGDAEAAARAAALLVPLAQASSVVPRTAVVTSGNAVFPELPAGVYLLTADAFVDEENGAQYYILPMLVSIPGRSVQGDADWHVFAAAKYTGQLDISVIKVWKNDQPSNRPLGILVQLKKNGEPEGVPVMLTKDKQWRHTWTDLDPTMEYTVEEVTKLSSYTTTIQQQGNLFQITNTRNTPPSTQLPQAGQLWWPVYAMGLGGMLLVLLGVLRSRRKNQ